MGNFMGILFIYGYFWVKIWMRGKCCEFTDYGGDISDNR